MIHRTEQHRIGATALMRHVYGQEQGIIAIFSGRRVEGNDLDNLTTKFFHYPDDLDTAITYAYEESDDGREAYYCSHLLTTDRRKKENAAPVCTLWGDLDGCPIPNGELAPTAVVESSTGRAHCYWRLSEAIAPKLAEKLNKRIAYAIGADPSGFDLTQVLRLPGTVNHKHGSPVELVSISDHVHSADALGELLPELAGKTRSNMPHSATASPSRAPVDLSGRAREVFDGKHPKIGDRGQIDRSASLLKIGRAVYDAGEDRAGLVDILRERDAFLYQKYTDRPDAEERYHGIVDELEREGRTRRARLTAVGGAPSMPEEEPQALDEPELPRIVTNNRNLRDVTTDALDAVAAHNDPPQVFVRSGELVRVREDENGIPGIQAMDLGAVRGRLARTADFVRVSRDGEARVNPPEIVVKDFMALDRWPFPPLEAVVETPILRPDGTIFDTPGYDSLTKLYYHPAERLDLPKINQTPTPEEVRDSLDLLNEAVGEFPYADQASAANTLALLLTTIVRQAVEGPVPLALIDKPQAGTGGSLLAETVAVIGSGRAAEMLGAPGDDEEWRKLITAKLSAGTTAVTIDNVDGPLFAPSLARALTARTWTDRVLGRSEVVTVSQRATWVATGNNIILRGDLPRRCYWVRLDAKASRPWQRDGFKHPDLIAWVTANRIKLVHALLTIARGWFAAGKPKAANVPRLGSFESWAETVGGIIAFASVSGFLDNLADLYDKADESGAEWEEFLEAWWNHQGDDPITGKGLTRLIKEHDALRNAIPDDLAETLERSEGSFTRQLGHALSKRAGTRFGDEGLHVANTGELRRAKLWSARKGSDSCEFVSFVSSYNPSACFSQDNNANDTPTGRGEINSNNSQTHTGEPAPENVDRKRWT